VPLKFYWQNGKRQILRQSEIHYEMILKIWKKIVKWYGKYPRKASWIVKRYGNYWRKVSWIVIRYGNYERKVSWNLKW
jgi:hypothetical protein